MSVLLALLMTLSSGHANIWDLTRALAREAIEAQTIKPSASFQEGMRWSAPTVTEYFIGRSWVCHLREAGDYTKSKLNAQDLRELRFVALDPTNDYAEICYAGYEFGFDDAAGFVTGP